MGRCSPLYLLVFPSLGIARSVSQDGNLFYTKMLWNALVFEPD